MSASSSVTENSGPLDDPAPSSQGETPITFIYPSVCMNCRRDNLKCRFPPRTSPDQARRSCLQCTQRCMNCVPITASIESSSRGR
ncbi:unnamed protein product [Mycena citricolor]|uniref:Zn(2)-C6 fungal-type domain-containing protein n=1 Tax=Mycena citricolor TaxID=2018698 RepID=A0AAD2HZ50_9AGAR|nr:unnamed protein product [Mycena citricolor]CAK5284901.1 unnamed protein product [Mycena citricolor]